jgi:hypothetical protein
MSHVINGVCNKILEIGNMLGVNEDEILNLRFQASNQEMPLLQEPSNNYKDRIGYYGTLSINDF